MKNKENIIKALINIGMIILSINLFIVLCFGFSPYRIKTGNINYNNPIFDITYIIAPIGFIITFIGIIISYILKPKVLSLKDKYGELKSLKGELSLEVYEKILDIIGR